MKNRIFRLLVCLVLVGVILVNCSPIRAKAVEPVTMVMVSAATVIASVMIGIGVMMGQNREAFDQVVQMVQGSNALKDFIQQDATKGDVIPLYRSPGTGGVGSGALSLLVAGALIEAIRQVLFEEDVVSSSSAPDGYAYYNDVLLPVIPEFDSDLIYLSIKRHESVENWYYVVASSFKPYYCSSTCFNNSTSGYKRSALLVLSEGVWEYNSSRTLCSYPDYCVGGTGYYIWSNFDVYDKTGATLYYTGSDPVLSYSSVADGLSAGEIAHQEQELSEGYSDWVSGSQWDVNNSQWWPVAVAPTYDETVNFSQEQVQKGEGTITDADLEDNSDSEQDPDSDQVTASGLKGWLDGIKDRMTLLLQPLALTVSNILDVVSGIPEALLNGIQRLFIPDAESMAAQQAKWTTLLSDRFGAVYDSVALIDNIAGAFTLGATQTQIRFPLITIPFGEVNWEFGGWMVDVVPDGFQVLVDALKVGIDILCTLAFVNAMKNRLERVLEGRG